MDVTVFPEPKTPEQGGLIDEINAGVLHHVRGSILKRWFALLLATDNLGPGPLGVQAMF
jgi:hypothetical protein